MTVNHFRNFKQSTFLFNPFLTIVAGRNSVGKTNLLEALFFGLRGHGFREEKEVELIHTETQIATVELERSDRDGSNTQKIILSSIPAVAKQCFFNKVKKRLHEYATQSMPAVVFSPSFLYVIDGQMHERRVFFDRMISNISKTYKRRLGFYEQALRKRNKLLEKITDEYRLKEQLTFWDTYLIQEASYITEKRTEVGEFLNQNPLLDHTHFKIMYHKNEISKKSLADTFEKQRLVRKTLVGPQRDIYELYIDGKNVHKYGSRSEQRLTLFWIVMNEMRIYEEKLKQKSVVLLDDIFSELDITNKSLVIDIVKNHQTIISTIDEDYVDHLPFEKTLIHLR